MSAPSGGSGGGAAPVLRVPFLPALALVLCYGAGLGLLAGGTDLGQAAVMGAGATLGYALAALLGYLAGRLSVRDAEAGWALSPGAAKTLLVALTFVTLLVHFPSALFLPLPCIAGWLAGRRSTHASDVAFLGVLSTLLVALPWHREAWDDSPLFLLPAILVAAALLAREAWDLRILRATMDAQRRPPHTHAGSPAPGPIPGPVPARGARRALLAATLVTLAGLALAWTLGLARQGVRDAYASLGETSVRNLALATFVAALAGVVWVLVLWKKGREENAGAR